MLLRSGHVSPVTDEHAATSAAHRAPALGRTENNSAAIIRFFRSLLELDGGFVPRPTPIARFFL